MKTNNRNVTGLGMFITGAMTALAVSGAILFRGDKSRGRRQKLAWWMEDAEDEVLKKVKKVKNISQDKFDEIVDKVVDKYEDIKGVAKDKIDELKEELKSRWDEVEEEAEKEDSEDDDEED
jgi:gas vesicle protein